ncbi:MAG: NACHT domain-containing protein [Candidatus Methanofastidiosia archaeon]
MLFHEARRSGKNITIFSDAAGDYYKLDSFEGDFKKYGKIGYQYKFYPSPMSAKHRKEIEKSLTYINENRKSLKIKKWILVTPKDFVESSTRKDGGDVTWFESLPQKLNLKFKIEHWGHMNLLSLFLETPSLCLYYYPELVPDGSTRKKTIQDTRIRYNNNLTTLYRKIEFVGMPIYKEETTRGVPMEDIYIPLTVVPEGADEKTTSSRINPLSFLRPGVRTVILGDPGSGKSTLLKFLSLVGLSSSLQTRYNAAPDERLPIFITLRRYADELKARRNLSLIDYIQEVIQCDFNLKSADLEFFEYYLENGQALLLFDGLDELPNPQFKKIVRDRIRTLLTTYPHNTTIVTSRIIGYNSPFRFDEKEFSHYWLARLPLPEIEQFVEDWYRVGKENEHEREKRVRGLIAILQNDDNKAIRELAENPLLLTIILLIYRIEAVLPDERVVLYRKCTETLLITWHTWKYHTEEVRRKGKEDRRNTNRIEEIAYWMHCQSVSTGRNEQAAVDHSELKKFLTTHIAEVEKVTYQDSDPEDLAEEFLDFVKKCAGLLMEVGGDRYSFIHLTFQEYLASSCISRRGEIEGVSSIWEIIKGNCGDARWHEVIRLLIAGLRADESREILVEKILEKTGNTQDVMHSLLLGGLLLDGIEAAEQHQEKILYHLFYSTIRTRETEELKLILDRVRTWTGKEEENEKAAVAAFKSLWKDSKDNEEKTALILNGFSLGWSEAEIQRIVGNYLYEEDESMELLRLFMCEMSGLIPSSSLKRRLEIFWAVKDFYSLWRFSTNIASAALQAVAAPLEKSIVAERVFVEQLTVLSSGPFGSSGRYVLYSLELFARRPSEIRVWARALALELELDRARAVDLDRTRALELDRVRALELDRARALDRILARDLDHLQDPSSEIDVWGILLTNGEFCTFVLDLLCFMFKLEPHPQWSEALRVQFLPRIQDRVTFYQEETWEKVEDSFEKENAGRTEEYLAASLLILDTSLFIYGYHESEDKSAFRNLADLTRELDVPPLRIAHCIRDLAYGDESHIEDLVSMVKSDDPEYQEIFEAALWRSRSK